MHNDKICAQAPAGRFGEAFPLGNGRLGVMAFGGVAREKLLLSENTFFSGSATTENNQKNAAKAYREMKKRSRAADIEGTEEAAAGFIGVQQNYGTNLPLGELTVELELSGPASSQQRELNIRDGVATNQYQLQTSSVQSKTYVSSALNMLVCRMSFSAPVSAVIRLIPYCSSKISPCDDGFRLRTRAVETMHSDGTCGVFLYGKARVMTDGQYQTWEQKVHGARELTLVFGAVTDFCQSGSEFRQAVENLDETISGLNADALNDDFSRHCQEMRQLFDRSVLVLDEPDDRPGRPIALLYQYGRYLLYCSSRKQSQLPAHLQGIWNDNVACRIGWTCDMHLDINTQMNYWPANVTGLPEVNEPLFRWMKEMLVPQGRLAASHSYGLPGWSAEIVSNAWGFAAPYWDTPIAASPGCGIWIATHLFEHYRYTEDERFLKNQAMPIIREAVRFFVEYVSLNERGQYCGGPSTSPENGFVVHGETRYMSEGTTFETLMIRELLDIYLKCNEILPEPPQFAGLVQSAGEVRGNLQPYRILPDGTLAEWSHNYEAADKQHRHSSHLLGLYPFSQITPIDTPELAKAARATIEQKLNPPENWEDTGWARSMLLLYSARLGMADSAEHHIAEMTGKLMEPNMMIIHPPTRGAGSFDNVYELDGNTGLTTGIAEILMQSHNGIIRILPALPDTWRGGSVTGLMARGNVRVSISWQEGKLTRVELETSKEKEVRVSYRGLEKNVRICGAAVLSGDFFTE